MTQAEDLLHKVLNTQYFAVAECDQHLVDDFLEKNGAAVIPHHLGGYSSPVALVGIVPPGEPHFNPTHIFGIVVIGHETGNNICDAFGVSTGSFKYSVSTADFLR